MIMRSPPRDHDQYEDRDGQLGRGCGGGPAATLSWFRLDTHACPTARADELCELLDWCTDLPIASNLIPLKLAAAPRAG